MASLESDILIPEFSNELFHATATNEQSNDLRTVRSAHLALDKDWQVSLSVFGQTIGLLFRNLNGQTIGIQYGYYGAAISLADEMGLGDRMITKEIFLDQFLTSCKSKALVDFFLFNRIL